MKIPSEVIEALRVQKFSNGGEWLATNYCDYYPNKVNFKNDKIVRYHELESGEIVIKETFFLS